MGKDWKPFVYGGVASMIAEFGTFPIDLTKTRLQVQGQVTDKAHSQLRYRGMVDCFMQVARNEGIFGLYSGLAPAILRQATYGTIKFGTYYSLKHHLITTYQYEENTLLNVGCAVFAGAISSSIANPTDVLKVRLQIDTSNRNGMIGNFRDIWNKEGLKGLWRGVGPTAQRAAVLAAVELPLYDWCKKHLLGYFGDNISNHFISSSIASVGSAIAATPIDVVRSRIMNQRNLKKSTGVPSDHIYTSSLDCVIKTLKNEGFWALYKGFVPTLVRMGPWNIIFFLTYEQLKILY